MGFRGSAVDVGQGVARVGARAAIAVSSAALFLGVAGCSVVDSAGAQDEMPGNALSQVEPCSILSPDKAVQAGLSTRSMLNTDTPSRPLCTYAGEDHGISIFRIAGDDLDSFEDRPVWRDFKRLKVNGRDGAEAHTVDQPDGECMTAISAGGGVVSILAMPGDSNKSFDACAESLKVAQLIESDLPE